MNWDLFGALGTIGLVLLAFFSGIAAFDRRERKRAQASAAASRASQDTYVKSLVDEHQRFAEFCAEHSSRPWQELRAWCESVRLKPCECATKSVLLRHVFLEQERARRASAC